MAEDKKKKPRGFIKIMEEKAKRKPVADYGTGESVFKRTQLRRAQEMYGKRKRKK